jgi:multidrug transporter EmrE-like cation transporter
MNISVISLILFGVLLNASAQLLLKAGMERIGQFAFSWSNALPIGMQVAANPYVLIGLACYVISVMVWLLVLSRIDVSVAYPMVSLGYVVNALIAYYWLGEELSFLRILGIVIILFGVFLVAKH